MNELIGRNENEDDKTRGKYKSQEEENEETTMVGLMVVGPPLAG
jgi:hypothetical protein